MKLSNQIKLIILLFSIFAYFVLSFYTANLKNQPPLNKNDQGAYITVAIKMKDSGYTYYEDRNRMPLYRLFMSTFYKKGDSISTIENKAQILSIVTSFVLLILIFLKLKGILGVEHSVAFTYIVAFSLFIFRSSFVQAELLFYTLFYSPL